MGSRTWHDEVIAFRLYRKETETGTAAIVSRSFPVSTTRHGGSHRVVIPRLECIARRPGSIQQPVNEGSRTTPFVAIDHHARGIVNDCSDGILRRASFEACVATAEDDTLQTAVTRNKFEFRGDERPIVFIGFRIEKMNTGKIAFPSPGRIQSRRAANGNELGPNPLELEFPQQIIQRNAVAADHDEIRQLKTAAQQLHLKDGSGFNDFFVPAYRGKAIGAAECGDTAGALAHGICGQCGAASLPWSFHKPDENVFCAADLTVQLHGQLRGDDRAFFRTLSSQHANDRSNEFVKRENGGSRKSRKHDDGAAAGRRKTDGLAGLQCNSVRDDSGS